MQEKARPMPVKGSPVAVDVSSDIGVACAGPFRRLGRYRGVWRGRRIVTPDDVRQKLKHMKDIGFDEVVLVSHHAILEDTE